MALIYQYKNQDKEILKRMFPLAILSNSIPFISMEFSCIDNIHRVCIASKLELLLQILMVYCFIGTLKYHQYEQYVSQINHSMLEASTVFASHSPK